MLTRLPPRLLRNTIPNVVDGEIVAYNTTTFSCALFMLKSGADKFIDHTVAVASLKRVFLYFRPGRDGKRWSQLTYSQYCSYANSLDFAPYAFLSKSIISSPPLNSTKPLSLVCVATSYSTSLGDLPQRFDMTSIVDNLRRSDPIIVSPAIRP